MKILIVNQFAATDAQAGSTRTYSFAKELVGLGHQVQILTGGFDHFRMDASPSTGAWRREEVEGVGIVRIPVASYQGNSFARIRNLVGFAWAIYRLDADRLGLDPDIILASSPYPFAAFAAMKVADRMRKPFALEIRDLWPQTMMDLWRMGKWNPIILLLRYIESRLYQSADPLICLLPNATDYLVARGASFERVVWIPNGVSMDQFGPWAKPVQSEPFEVLYAGTHGLANGLDSLLDAFRLLQEEGYEGKVVLRLVGNGHQKMRLQARCEKEEIRMVEFEESVPKLEVHRRMAKAHAFIVTLKDLPLYRYGISLNKIHEYLAAGRPIVFGSAASNDPVKEAEAGYTVTPEDPIALAAGVKKLLGLSAAERNAMGIRGREYASEHHDFPKLARHLEASLLEAMARWP